jgi:hypothetical protein
MVLVIVGLIGYIVVLKRDLSQLHVEVLHDSEIDLIDQIKINYFHTANKCVYFREEDGTEGVYIQDRKTFANLAYAFEDGVIHTIKQQNNNGSNKQ